MTEQRVARPFLRVGHMADPDPRPAEVEHAGAAAHGGTGEVLAGRFRLLAQLGADAAIGAVFWQARDAVLERDVAVTVLHGPSDPAISERATAILNRAIRTGHLEHPGCARLLDVLDRTATDLPDGVLGLAVTEWVPGRSLAEVVADGSVRAMTAVRIVQPLAQAAEQAHRQGLVLGCNHPQRIRISPDGRAAVAFPLPRPETTPADDVRGLGATLYTLLTRRWPLSGADAARAGIAAVPRDAEDGVRPEPTAGPAGDSTADTEIALRPGVPHELATLINGTLGAAPPAGRVHTAAAVHHTLADLAAVEQDTALLPPIDDGVPEPGDVWREEPPPDPPDDADRRRKLRIGLACLGGALLVAAGYVGLQLAAFFGAPDNPPSIVVAGPSGGPSDAGGQLGPSEQVSVAGLGVYDNTGDRDNAGRVSAVVDGDPSSTWRTFTYRQQFPALKPGVGIMVSFASPVQLATLTVLSPSAGTQLEIRSAPSADAPFAATVPITTARLGAGSTEVSLAASQPVNHVLIWIVKLGGNGDSNATEIAELVFRRATG